MPRLSTLSKFQLRRMLTRKSIECRGPCRARDDFFCKAREDFFCKAEEKTPVWMILGKTSVLGGAFITTTGGILWHYHEEQKKEQRREKLIEEDIKRHNLLMAKIDEQRADFDALQEQWKKAQEEMRKPWWKKIW